jgi:DNA-binding FadR family transcriptional regulator
LRVWATKILETERDTLSISNEHAPIVAAIAVGDTEAARYEMEKHMRGAAARLRRVLTLPTAHSGRENP